MKYFAKLDLNNKVISVTHVGENNAPTEEAGIEYLNNLHSHSSWKEFTRHGKIRKNNITRHGTVRKNSAQVGMIYDKNKNAFLWLKNSTEWPSSIFNEETCKWEHPTPHPTDHHIYHWNENILGWVAGVGEEGRL